MKIKEFFRLLLLQAEPYQKVWLYIFAHLEDPITLSELASISKVSKTHANRIVYWGLDRLRDMGVANYIESSPSGIVISIGKTKQTKEVVQDKPSTDKVIIEEIIQYLNQKTNKNYSSKAKEAQKHISARLKENYTLQDFKKVIDIKTEKWLGTNMEDYLRPITLFGTKFNSYLNERTNEQQSVSQSQIARSIATAQRVADQLSAMDSESD